MTINKRNKPSSQTDESLDTPDTELSDADDRDTGTEDTADDDSSRDAAGQNRHAVHRGRTVYRFTAGEQAFIDGRIGEARRKARDAERSRILQKAGINDLDDLFDLVSEAHERRSRDASHVQDLTNRVVDLEGQLTTVQRERERAQTDRLHALRLADIRVRASALGFTDLDDPARFLGDLSVFPVDDTSTVQGIQDALVKLAADRPYLLGNQPTSDGSGSGVPVLPVPAPVRAPESTDPPPAVSTPPAVETPTPPAPTGPVIPVTPSATDVRVQGEQEKVDARKRIRHAARSMF